MTFTKDAATKTVWRRGARDAQIKLLTKHIRNN